MKQIHTNCLICDRIKQIKQDINLCFVLELQSGFVVMGDHQFYKGYTLFLCKEHTSELHLLNKKVRKQFLWEMSLVGEAVINTFQPLKLNYELLGNKDSHMHWHLFPRHHKDPDPNRPIWSYPKEKRCNDKTKINNKFINKYKPVLKTEIQKLINFHKQKNRVSIEN